jgi:uncharacterized protein
MTDLISTLPTPAAPARENARRPVPLGAVTLGPGMLGDWQRLNRTATIPHCLDRLESTGVLDNLRRLVGESDAPFRGPLFADSDLYKTLEAIGWEAVTGDVTEHLPFVDETVRLLTRAQEPDGYLNSYYQGPHVGGRFTDLPQGHELYCLGHLVQAAVAWHHAGRDDLLTIALRFVDLVHSTFGPGRRDDICGHPEIETALVELSRVTGDPRHRELARRMVELRGYGTVGEGAFGNAYYQDQVPVRAAREATGHAVRQLYLLAGVTDLQLDDPDAGYADTLDALWTSVHEEKLYVTGGLGSRHRGEAFGDPYELPADRAYSETCAAIADLHWAWRMLLWRGEARYADAMERALYNAIAVSTGVDGRSFFYSNPLHLRTRHAHEEDAPSERLDWYACACCPPNLARLLSSIGGYLLTRSADAVQVQLYAAGTLDLGDGCTATVETDHPWSGAVRITLDRPSTTAVELRIPAWTGAGTVQVRVDGATQPVAGPGYHRVEPGARSIELDLPMEPVLERAHPWVDASRSAVALRRGPVYYCVETADLPASTVLEDVVLTAGTGVRTHGWDPDLAAVRLEITGARRRTRTDALPLYRPAPADPAAPGEAADATGAPGTTDLGPVTAVPYYRWANRTRGAMRVWLPTA